MGKRVSMQAGAGPSSTVPSDLDANFAQPYGKQKLDKIRMAIPDVGTGKAYIECAISPNPSPRIHPRVALHQRIPLVFPPLVQA